MIDSPCLVMQKSAMLVQNAIPACGMVSRLAFSYHLDVTCKEESKGSSVGNFGGEGSQNILSREMRTSPSYGSPH